MLRNRVLYLDLLLLSFVFFVLFEQYVFHLLFLFLLLLPLLSLLLALPACFFIRYRMDIEEDIVPKGAYGVLLSARNDALLPCAYVRMQLLRQNMLGRDGARYVESAEETVQFSLGVKRTFTIRPSVEATHCGKIDLAVRRVQICDLLGLFSLPVPRRNALCDTGSVYILPALQTRHIRTEDAAALGLDSATYSTEKAGGDPAEVFRLRDYQEGDAKNSLHWKLSWRMQRLIVREFGLPLNPSLHFLLEIRPGSEPAAAENMLGAALAYSEYLMVREVVHQISWLNEDQTLRTVSVGDANALAAALHELLALPAQKKWSTLVAFAMRDDRQPETDVFYLVAGASQTADTDEEAERVIARLPELGVCRRITLLPDRCTKAAAERLRAVGCEVQLLSGHAPNGREQDAEEPA